MANKYAANRSYITLRCALMDQMWGLDGIMDAIKPYSDQEKWLARELLWRREKIALALKQADRELGEARVEEVRKAA